MKCTRLNTIPFHRIKSFKDKVCDLIFDKDISYLFGTHNGKCSFSDEKIRPIPMGGFRHLIDVHRGFHITEEQRQRFVDLYMQAADQAHLPDDQPFREALKAHVDFGSHVAKQNSNATTEAELHPLREVPKWTW